MPLHASPPDAWYQVQLVAHWRLKQFKQATDLLKVLVTRQPENAFFWQQLAYGYQQQNDDKSVLVTLRGAYVKGVLQSDKYVRWLAQLLIQEGSPQRAVEIIRESLTAKRLKNNRTDTEDAGSGLFAGEGLSGCTAIAGNAGGAD